jgi:hypothetical protein
MIYWGLTRVSRVFQMVYWLASPPRPIHSSHPHHRPTAHAAQDLHFHPHARHATGPPPPPPPPRTAGQWPAARYVTGPPPSPPPPRMAGQRPAAPAHAHAPAHTSCCGAAAEAGPGTAGPGFLPLPFGRPTGRLAAAAAAAASCSCCCRCCCACHLASTSRSTTARSTYGGGRFLATRLTPCSRRGSAARAAGRAWPLPDVSEWFYGPELEFTSS